MDRVLFPMAMLLACGPNVATDGDTGTGTSDGTTATATTDPSTSATVSTTTTTSTTSTTSAETTTSDDDGSSFIMDTWGMDVPPGADCVPPEPGPEPPLPDGCEHVWLVDANGNPLEGAYSGYVRCTNVEAFDFVAYRTAYVGCPELLGNDCLCDADCDPGSACVCANELTAWAGYAASNYCMPADCASADDCNSGECRIDGGICVGGWGAEAMRCTTAADDCLYPSECDKQGGQLCDYDEVNELFTCDPGAICE